MVGKGNPLLLVEGEKGNPLLLVERKGNSLLLVEGGRRGEKRISPVVAASCMSRLFFRAREDSFLSSIALDRAGGARNMLQHPGTTAQGVSSHARKHLRSLSSSPGA